VGLDERFVAAFHPVEFVLVGAVGRHVGDLDVAVGDRGVDEEQVEFEVRPIMRAWS
jgi:hypothetical protein